MTRFVARAVLRITGSKPQASPYHDRTESGIGGGKVRAAASRMYQRLQVRLGGRLCAAHAAADRRRSVCLTYLCDTTD